MALPDKEQLNWIDEHKMLFAVLVLIAVIYFLFTMLISSKNDRIDSNEKRIEKLEQKLEMKEEQSRYERSGKVENDTRKLNDSVYEKH